MKKIYVLWFCILSGLTIAIAGEGRVSPILKEQLTQAIRSSQNIGKAYDKAMQLIAHKKTALFNDKHFINWFLGRIYHTFMPFLTKSDVINLEDKNKKQALASLERAINLTLNMGENSYAIGYLNKLLTTKFNDQQREALLKDYFFAKIKKNRKKHIEFLVTHIDPTLLKTTNQRGKTPLIAAIAHNAIDVAQYFITKNIGISQIESNGRAPLIKAIEKNNSTIVKHLLNRHADTNQTDYKGNTPLIKAIKKNNSDMVSDLITFGANMNELDGNGNLPLVVAIANKNPEIAKHLIIRGAQINKADARGITPLLAAINAQSIPLINQLLLKGVSVRKQELEAARKTGNQEIIKLLSQETPKKKKNRFFFWRK